MNRSPVRLISLIALAFGATQVLADTGPLFDAPMVPVREDGLRNVAFGDVDEDGIADLVVVVAGNPSAFLIFTNRGDGRFLPPTRFDIGDGLSPRDVSIADINGDGHQDLVLYLMESLGVFLGAGDGSFGAIIESPVDVSGSTETDIETPDLNGDGAADVVLCDAQRRLYTLFGDGGGAFSGQITYEVGDEDRVYDVAAGDLDDDGDLDLVACTETAGAPSGSIIVLRNPGDGAMLPPEQYPLSSVANSVAVVDMDGDAVIDVVTGSGPDVAVLLGVGDGTLAPPIYYPAGTGSRQMACGDLNGDGRPDVVVESESEWAVILNAGDGSLLPPDVYNSRVYYEVVEVLLEDVDNDADLDMAVLRLPLDSFQREILIVRPNAGDGTFPRPTTFGMGDPGYGLASADFDSRFGDDLVGGQGPSSEDMATVLSDGKGMFAPPVFQPALGEVLELVSGDVDGDGWMDVAAIHRFDGTLSLLRNQGDGVTFSGLAYETGVNPKSLAIGDVDLDGDLDFIVDDDNYPGPGRFALLPNRGDGTLGEPEIFEHDEAFLRFATGDLDGDGDPDAIAIAISPSLRMLLFENTNGSFAKVGEFTLTSFLPEQMTIGDLNGDGLGEIFMDFPDGVAQTGLRVYLNQGGFTFQETNYGQNVEVWRDIVITDLDGDGWADVACAGYQDEGSYSSLVVYRGQGDGLLEPPVRYLVQNHNDLVAGDFDANGAADLAVNGQGLQVLFNQHDACLGDLDGDRDIDQDDLGILLAAYEVDASGDIDGDGVTGQPDLGLLLANFGRVCD